MRETDQLIAQASAPFLQQGEVIELATVGRYGGMTPSVVASLLVTIGSLGALPMSPASARTPIVLTSSRLLVLATKGFYERPRSKLTHAFQRSELRAREPRTVMGWTLVELTDAQGRLAARLRFKLQSRAAALRLAELLGRPSDGN